MSDLIDPYTGKCMRKRCSSDRSPFSPLYLCYEHQEMVDNFTLGWNSWERDEEGRIAFE